MAQKSSAHFRDRALLERLWTESIERYTLPNGLTVLLKKDAAAPVCSVQVWVKTGSIHESAHLGAGLSHYLEHMLFKGTEHRAGRDLSATVQAHGGYINAYTTFDRTVYYIDIPAEHTAVALDLLADATLRSTLPADEVAKKRKSSCAKSTCASMIPTNASCRLCSRPRFARIRTASRSSAIMTCFPLTRATISSAITASVTRPTTSS